MMLQCADAYTHHKASVSLRFSCMCYQILFCHLCNILLWKYAWYCNIMFLSTDYLFEKKIQLEEVTSDLPYKRLIYYSKDNQQGCSRLSNLFSLQCLGPWMNHLPPVWWSTCRFRIVIFSWRKSFIWWKGTFLLISCFYSCFIHNSSFAYYFSAQMIYSRIAFLYQVLCTDIFHRCSLYFFGCRPRPTTIYNEIGAAARNVHCYTVIGCW